MPLDSIPVMHDEDDIISRDMAIDKHHESKYPSVIISPSLWWV